MPRVFLSYARADGEAIANEVRQRLGRVAPDVVPLQDHFFMRGGSDWWSQITAAIDSVDFLILLVTHAALASGNVANEWRYARQRGVCVFPVKAVTDFDALLRGMPEWMGSMHFYDLNAEWDTFVRDLRDGCRSTRKPFMARKLPAYYVERSGEFNRVKQLLLAPRPVQDDTPKAGICGVGGIGKTTLATALCHDHDILEHFHGGILWITLGQTPDISGALSTLYAVLTGDRQPFSNIETAIELLKVKLDEQRCLIVIDDVWDAAHLSPFLSVSGSSECLFTTRAAGLSSLPAVGLGRMANSEAVALLTRRLSGIEVQCANQLLQYLGAWPLAIELAASMVRERVRMHEPLSVAVAEVVWLIRNQGVRALQNPGPPGRHRTMSDVLEASLACLEDGERTRLSFLSIFPEDVDIPLSVAASAWQCDERTAREMARRMARLSLIDLDLGKSVIRLHDVIRSWLAPLVTETAEVHGRVAGAWPNRNDLPDLPDQYAWRWLPWHLHRAGHCLELEQILRTPAWLRSKIKTTDPNCLLRDYDLIPQPSKDTQLLESALRLSSGVIAADPVQFTSQMLGRLLAHENFLVIRRFLGKTAALETQPWLRPLRASLHPPGTELIRTLKGQTGPVSKAALTADGSRVVSVSSDNTIRIWNIETGRVLRELKDKAPCVGILAMTPEGRTAFTGSRDGVLKLWDLERESLLHVWQGTGPVAVLDGGKSALCAVGSMLRLLDLQTGEVLRWYNCPSWVHSIAMPPGGRHAILGCDDAALRILELETGAVIRQSHCHSGSIVCVAVNGDRAVSASSDGSLVVWNLDKGVAVHRLQGHGGPVLGVAVTPDGARAVSASADNTLRVWDMATGALLHKIEGHASRVNSVAITADGRRAASASDDHTVKIWDLTAPAEQNIRECHLSAVDRVGVTADQTNAVSLSEGTLKVWNMDSGKLRRTIEGPGVESMFQCATSHKRVTRLEHILDWSKYRAYELRGTERPRFSGGIGPAEQIEAVIRATSFSLPENPPQAGKPRLTASISGDGTVLIKESSTGRILHTLRHRSPITLVALHSDSRALSGSSDGALILWDVRTGMQLAAFHCDAAPSCCIFADHNKLVAGDASGQVHILVVENAAGTRR